MNISAAAVVVVVVVVEEEEQEVEGAKDHRKALIGSFLSDGTQRIRTPPVYPRDAANLPKCANIEYSTPR